MPFRSALLRAIRKFLSPNNGKEGAKTRRETWSVSQFHRIVLDLTNNSFLPLSLRFSRPSYPFRSFSSRPRVSLPSRPLLSLVIFHARLDGAFIVSSERAPPNEMFSRSSRASSGRLSTNNPRRVPRSEVRYTTSEAGSDLESRQGASRPH